MAVQLLVEVLAGIDPTTSDLQSDDVFEYWLKDEADQIIATGFDGIVPGNHWAIDGSFLTVNPTGIASRYWEKTGDFLIAKG